ncbi:LysM peptidoglycan-binding domain-containing protein [Paenibacillus sp. PL91]|uniref:LysM peptidoglycan-binding domain-containing protein n=1 Tax=Paenibacillus sp. PL91 TaxID=2729538 RepID=UPI00145E9307|nr:LysM domain-containing protein [Paenibacillus sp. PL91]MBC9200107.1 LysM peptidoglycan-binding domain-containing protein [Paenibacillus sp. PL91]
MENKTTRSNKRSKGSLASFKKATLSLYLAVVIILVATCGILYSKYTNLVDTNLQTAAAEQSETNNQSGNSDASNSDSSNYGQNGNESIADEPVPAGTVDAEETQEPTEVIAGNTKIPEPTATESPVKNIDEAVTTVPKQAEKPSHEQPESNNKPTDKSQGVKLPTTYVVQKGDTLRAISEKFYQTKDHYALLAEHNHIFFINDMKAGDTLTIPALFSGNDSTSGKPQETKDYSKITLPATYLIQAGDTLSGISRMFYKSAEYVDYIASENKLDKNEGLKAGTNLVIPSLKNYTPDKNIGSGDNSTEFEATEHTVQKGETLYSISKTYYGTTKHAMFIADYNHIFDIDQVKAGTVLKIPKS